MIAVTTHDRAVLRLPWSALLANKAHELWTKATGRRIKGQGMIGADHAAVRDGFASLRGGDFGTYNLPQAWVERRQIPKVLHGRVPRLNATVVDLGCGPGTSTEVLCHFADPSWTIIGYDLTAHLIEAARARAARGEFRNRDGVRISPAFMCQNIAGPLMVEGVGGTLAPIGDASVDLAVSGGVVGLYLRMPDVVRLLAELRRVVKPAGFVALDAGPAIPGALLTRLAATEGFSLVGKATSFIIEPRPKLIYQMPAA